MKSVIERVAYYRNLEQEIPHSGILREVKLQYADMAAGGDGGLMGYTPNDYAGPPPGPDGVSCRAYNYPDHSDEFFQEVCDLLGWAR